MFNTAQPLSVLLVAASLLFLGVDATMGQCFKGSSNSAANDYPPITTTCDIHPDEGEGATGMVCFVGKVKNLNFYSMSCITATNCNRERDGVIAGTNELYENVVCCTEVDNCNDYENIVEDGSGEVPSCGVPLAVLPVAIFAATSYAITASA